MNELILGLDPGSRTTGYGVIAVPSGRTSDGRPVSRDQLIHICHGVIRLSDSGALADRLKFLHLELQNLFSQYPIKTVVIEKIFFGKSADSAFKLGHARGVALLAAAENGAEIAEYAARKVKKVITGNGAADKVQVQLLVSRILGIRPLESAFDASDALSLAICHTRLRDTVGRLQKMLEGNL